ncbi:MAG: metalloregulator ArsR/SmtB family transcription factor [Gemmatimonadaceae bacterium]
MIAPHADVNLIFHALGDPTRRAIVERLSKRGPLSATALAEPMGITVTAVTQHIRVLEGCRLVRSEKVGRVRSCRVEPAGFSALTRWVDAQRTMWERRLDRMSAILAEDEE